MILVNILTVLTYAISFIFAISVLVLIHEGGHFIVAKLVGIKVNEFSIGMGPKLYGFQKGETAYNLRWIPIGGFIKPEGEDEESEHPRAFGNKPLWARAAVVAAGPISNFILAYVIIVLLISFWGVNYITIGDVMPNSPAASVGLQKGDVIKKVDNKNIYIFEELIDMINRANGKDINLTILRNKQETVINVPLKYNEENKRYIIGIGAGMSTPISFSISKNFTESLYYSSSLTTQIQYGLKRMFTGQITKDDVSGPVGIVMISGAAASAGAYPYVTLIALLSLSLGIFNLFPIPALDGGRLIFFLIEGIRRKRIEPEKEAMVHFVGFALLMVLIIFVTFNDVKRWVFGM